MTIENCITFCSGNSTGANGIPAQPLSFIFAGTEFSQECCKYLICSAGVLKPNYFGLDCDNFIENGATNATATDCNSACTGNHNELCGAADRLNVFFSGGTPPPAPLAPPTIGQWESIGCYRCAFSPSYEHQLVTHHISDSVNARTLQTGVGVTRPMTADACVAQCQSDNFPLAGLEFADQCCTFFLMLSRELFI